MSETQPLAAPPPPPHPRAVWRMLKQAHRNYLASGNAAGITIPTVTGWVHTAAKNITGTVQVNPTVPMPATVSVAIKQGTTTVFTVSGAVTPGTGAWSVTVPANTLAANTFTAVATTANPAASTTSNSFVVT